MIPVPPGIVQMQDFG